MNAILIDDEQLALRYLEHQLSAFPDIQIIGQFTNPLSGAEAIAQMDVDVVFLDIQIPECNGLELADQLLERNPHLHIVFVTAYESFAVKAFEINALDYLLKPVGKDRLHTTLDRVKERMAEQKEASPSSMIQPLSLTLFQQFSLSHDDFHAERTIEPLRWRTAKSQQLFLYLLQHRNQSVNKNTVIELLWPELDEDRAYQQLYTAIYYIRKTILPYDDYLQIHSTLDGYMLQLHHVVVDIDGFEQLVRTIPPLSLASLPTYEQALHLACGDYLQNHTYVWAESERRRLQLLWLQLAFRLCRWYVNIQELDKALQLGLEICRRSPFEEEAYLLVMQTMDTMGKSAEIREHYLQLQATLYQELQVTPGPVITHWYRNWEQRMGLSADTTHSLRSN